MADFRELLQDGRPHVFDGAMGTMLYARGVYINRSYDELNLREPELVREVHLAYLRAGAEVLETNSYGANRLKLARYGLEEELRSINARAAEIARSVAGERVCVAGAIGPLGVRIEPYGPTSAADAQALFREQAEGLLEGGVDLFLFETFSDLLEIQQAILAVRALCGHPIVAQMVMREDGSTPFGTDIALCAERLGEWGADVVGINCSVGPHAMLGAIERMTAATSRPLSFQPNAGLPREVDGRKIYMASPEYMAKYAARLIRKGARFVGGCCGTTPEHIAKIAGAVRALVPGSKPVLVQTADPATPVREPVPLGERSQWGAKLARGEFLTTVEIVPPRGTDPEAMLEGVQLLKEAGIDGVNVPDGPRAQSRMGVLATSLLIQNRVGIEPVIHYCCRDRNLLGMLSDLLGAQALGLRNLLLITGDPPKMGPYPDATAVFDIDAIGLTNLVSRLNRGLDPGGNAIGDPTSFVVGVGVNPGATDLEHELRRFYWKVDAGAEYAITQPVFDVAQLVRFIEHIEKEGIRIPIVAGIWPLVSARNAEFLANEVPGVVVPDEVLDRMRRASALGKEHGVEEGIRIAQEMLTAALPEIQGVQVSAPFGKVPLALRVFEALPGRTPAGTREAVVA
ncbi:MAG: bifunctional homocysteine S-methyltransferase/methylenetetrahydrofolate reductase [Gemmatimonadetes bacterium]|nr:bifunctional homocysteine S-methyltransferase/methylenetetrahydrofolate reductase [Gemmatimonadota bacterium]